jgi:hypothetical protein
MWPEVSFGFGIGNMTIKTYLHIASDDVEDTDTPAYRFLGEEAVHNPKTWSAEYVAVHTSDQGPIPADQQVQAYKVAQVPVNRIHLHSLHRPSVVPEWLLERRIEILTFQILRLNRFVELGPLKLLKRLLKVHSLVLF